jgi:hypothetical protein
MTQRLRIKSDGNPAGTTLVIVTTDSDGKETLTPLESVENLLVALHAGGDGYVLLTIHGRDVDLDLDAHVPREQADETIKLDKEDHRHALRHRP